MTERRLPVWLTALALVPGCWVLGWLAYSAVRALTLADGCYQSAGASDLRWAQVLLTAVVLGLLAPWVVSFTRRDEWWLLPLGLVASAVAAVGAADAWMSSTASWTPLC